MEKEDANWCRFALLIINEGGKVLRHLFLLESLSSVFTHYSSFWIQQLDELESKLDIKKLHECLNKSTQPSQNSLQTLLTLPTLPKGTSITLMEYIDTLQQWKTDIENELVFNNTDGGNTILISWSSQIQQEHDKLNSILRRWDSAFLDKVIIAQVRLLAEIEKQEKFPLVCIDKLKIFPFQSRLKFQQVIQTLKKELDTWKSNCISVLKWFEEECKSLVQLWQNEAEGSELMTQFLADVIVVFKTEGNAQELINRYYGNHCEELEGLLTTYERKASKCDSIWEIFHLIANLRTDLAQVRSFKNILFTDYVDKIKKNLAPLSLKKKLESKLDVIVKTGDLETADNSLLMILIRKSNLIHFKFQEFDEDPPDCDVSISACLLRLSCLRNSVVAHTAQGKIPSKSFDNLWKEAKEVICKIASICGKTFEASISHAIDQKKECPLETGRDVRLKHKIVEWCRNDMLTQLSAGSSASSRYVDMLQSIRKAQANSIGNIKAQSVYVCSSCDVEFSQEPDLSKHKCSKDPRSYTCSKCEIKFADDVSFSNHKCIQAPKYYLCGKCRRLLPEGDFKNHKCSVVPERMKCNECWVEFSAAKDFQEHKCIQAPRAYECDKCKTVLDTEEGLKNHICDEVSILALMAGGATGGASGGAISASVLGPIGIIAGGAIGGAVGGVLGGAVGLIRRYLR